MACSETVVAFRSMGGAVNQLRFQGRVRKDRYSSDKESRAVDCSLSDGCAVCEQISSKQTDVLLVIILLLHSSSVGKVHCQLFRSISRFHQPHQAPPNVVPLPRCYGATEFRQQLVSQSACEHETSHFQHSLKYTSIYFSYLI